MLLALLIFYAGLAAIILALGRGLLVLLRLAGVESWAAGFALAMLLGVLVCPTIVANHGIGLVPWIMSPGEFGWGILATPVTCCLAWLAMGQPYPPAHVEPRLAAARKPASAATVLKFPEDDPPA